MTTRAALRTPAVALGALLGAALGGRVAEATSANEVGQPQGWRLRQVQVAFRHGARTPYQDVPSDPPVPWFQHEIDGKHKLDLAKVEVVPREDKTGRVVGAPLTAEQIRTIDHKYHPELLDGGAVPARLTTVGMEQAIELGIQLRRRYVHEINLLPREWPEAQSLVFVRSTETERTIETAQGVLSGLYPSQIDDKSPATIFLKAKGDREWGVATFGNWCPRLGELFESGTKALAGPVNDEQRRLLNELEENVKLEVPENAGAFTISTYRDQLACRLAHGKAMPAGTEAVIDAIARLNRADAERIFSIFAGGSRESQSEATRLHAGRMLLKMIQSIESHDDDSQRLVLYSGHDWTIIMLLLALDPEAADPRTRDWPKFCSDLAVELWEGGAEEEGAQFVRILLDGEPLELPHLRDPKGPAELPKYFYTFEGLRAALDEFFLHEHELEELCRPLSKVPPAKVAKPA